MINHKPETRKYWVAAQLGPLEEEIGHTQRSATQCNAVQRSDSGIAHETHRQRNILDQDHSPT